MMGGTVCGAAMGRKSSANMTHTHPLQFNWSIAPRNENSKAGRVPHGRFRRPRLRRGRAGCPRRGRSTGTLTAMLRIMMIRVKNYIPTLYHVRISQNKAQKKLQLHVMLVGPRSAGRLESGCNVLVRGGKLQNLLPEPKFPPPWNVFAGGASLLRTVLRSCEAKALNSAFASPTPTCARCGLPELTLHCRVDCTRLFCASQQWLEAVTLPAGLQKSFLGRSMPDHTRRPLFFGASRCYSIFEMLSPE